MTHPLSIYWDQPEVDNILIDSDCAMISEDDFKKLHEYSTSIPTGMYEGKMWKSKVVIKDEEMWYLCWYENDMIPERVHINSRKLVVIGD